jgi:hypothetical protein
MNGNVTNKRKFNCRTCDKIYSTKQSRWLHEKICKNKISIKSDKSTQLEIKKIELEKLKEEKELIKLKNIQENANKFDEMKSIVFDLKIQIKKLEENKEIELNNRFLNIIAEKNNTIKEFNNKFQALKENKELVTINQEIKEIKSLTFNGVVIVSRSMVPGFILNLLFN